MISIGFRVQNREVLKGQVDRCHSSYRMIINPIPSTQDLTKCYFPILFANTFT